MQPGRIGSVPKGASSAPKHYLKAGGGAKPEGPEIADSGRSRSCGWEVSNGHEIPLGISVLLPGVVRLVAASDAHRHHDAEDRLVVRGRDPDR